MQIHFEKINQIVMLTVGAIIAAFSVEEFLAPNDIFDGGVVGISMILAHFTPIKLGVLTLIINSPFLVYAWKRIGHVFIISAGYAMAVFAVFLGIFEPLAATTEDLLLATVFGGVTLGVGVGMVLRGGGCLDGTEIVGIIASRISPFSTGNIIFFINVIIYIIAGAIFGLDSGLYSIIMYFISSKIIDLIESGVEQVKSLMIVSEDGRRIADAIYQNFGRTVTFIRGEGLVSGTEKDILYCVVTRAEIHDIRKMINEMDVEAFTTISDVSEIIGRHIKQKG